jgi:hypothetical protein
MDWRYQPVFIETDDGPQFGVCEIHLDDKGLLEGWSEVIEPAGDTIDALRESLAQMLADAKTWKPVDFAELETGFQFERQHD